MCVFSEVLEACRGVCGEDFIIGFRLTGDEEIEGGFTLEEGLEFSNIQGKNFEKKKMKKKKQCFCIY